MKNGTLVLEEHGIDREFREHVEMAGKMPPHTADTMIIAYSYYKQATIGNVDFNRPTESSNVILAFKFDAWKRLEGMTKEEAKRKYIDTVKRMLKGY